METNTLYKLEAVLFAYGKLVSEGELSNVLLLPPKDLKSLLTKLQERYSSTQTALQLIDEGGFWKLTVKDEYLSLVKSIVTKTELDRPTMETLAIIAFKFPLLQSEVIETRGSGAYEHIKTLSDLGYVIKEKKGRSFQLKLTPKFFDYFDLPREKLKEVFSKHEDLAKSLSETEAELKVRKQEEKKNKKAQEVKGEHKTLNKFSK